MAMFSRKPEPPGESVPARPMGDAELARAEALMAEFNRAVGHDGPMRKVSADIFQAAGVQRFEELLVGDRDAHSGWRWLADASSAAARRNDVLLPSQIYAFTLFWNLHIVPLLRPADWVELCLDTTPPDVRIRITAAALSCLTALPSEQAVMGNSTGQLTAGSLATSAAQEIVDFEGEHPAVTPKLMTTARRVLAPPEEPPAGTGVIDQLVGPAVAQLDRVKNTLRTLGITFVDLGAAMVGVGVGIAWGETDFVVLSVAAGGLENTLNLTAGVLRDIEHDRLAALDICNSLTRDNAAYPFFLHDAEAGWDVIVQQRYPVELLVGSPALLGGWTEHLSTMAASGRERCLGAGVQGQPYRWRDDAQRLLLRSLL